MPWRIIDGLSRFSIRCTIRWADEWQPSLCYASRQEMPVMSDEPFMLPRPPLMTREKARDVARAYKALAGHFVAIQVPREATRAEQQSVVAHLCYHALADEGKRRRLTNRML